MSSIHTRLPGEQEPVVYVRHRDGGEPKPCLQNMLSYARDAGYVLCDDPAAIPKADTAAFSPEETEADRQERVDREQERIDAFLESLGLGPAVDDCSTCAGSGVTTGTTVEMPHVPCSSCYAAWTALHGTYSPATTDPVIPPVGSDNGGAIVGAPASVSTSTSASLPPAAAERKKKERRTAKGDRR